MPGLWLGAVDAGTEFSGWVLVSPAVSWQQGRRVNTPQARRIPWDAGTLVLSMIVFGFGTQRAEWRWASYTGLVAAGWILARWGVAAPEAPALFGLRAERPQNVAQASRLQYVVQASRLHLRFLLKLLLSLGLGFVLAIAFRAYRGWDWLPRGLTWVAALAALIGAAEELIYRGYVYGRMRAWGPLCAGATAAAGHTLYKCALFALTSSLAELLFLAGVTFLAGLLFGLLRERLGGTVFPVAAHAAFDILVYGGWPRPVVGVGVSGLRQPGPTCEAAPAMYTWPQLRVILRLLACRETWTMPLGMLYKLACGLRLFRPATADTGTIIFVNCPPVGSTAFCRYLSGLARYARGGLAPLAAHVAVNGQCPNRCARCSNVVRGVSGAPLDQLKQLLAGLKNAGVASISLTGGEPLLRPDLPELVSACGPEAATQLFTSGHGLNGGLAGHLRDAGLAAAFVSLDHFRETEHDRACAGAGVRSARPCRPSSPF